MLYIPYYIAFFSYHYASYILMAFSSYFVQCIIDLTEGEERNKRYWMKQFICDGSPEFNIWRLVNLYHHKLRSEIIERLSTQSIPL